MASDRDPGVEMLESAKQYDISVFSTSSNTSQIMTDVCGCLAESLRQG